MKEIKLIAVLLALILLVSGCGKDPSTANSTPTPDYDLTEIIETFGGGSGTEDDPYQIATARQLRRMAELVNNWTQNYNEASYVLTADIALGGEAEPWTPIGGVIRADGPAKGINSTFRGSFDGGEHTISGMYLEISADAAGAYHYYGLFGAASGGSIRNLTLADSHVLVHYEAASVGGIVGDASGTLIYNCLVSADVTVSGGSQTGGIVGSYMYGANHDGSITDCANDGTVLQTTEVGYAGGIVGSVRGNISGCINTGPVESAGDCGGIVGFFTGELSGCQNSGGITGSYAGGIAASLLPNDIGTEFAVWDVSVTGCSNSGAVTGVDLASGIVAISTNDGKGTVTISDCENSGVVSLEGETINTRSAGGILGRYQSHTIADAELVISKCVNTGEILGVSEEQNTLSGVAATINANNGHVLLENCSNSGAVGDSMGSSGGILGSFSPILGVPKKTVTLTLIDCSNEADIVGGGFGTGGIAGEIDADEFNSAVSVKLEDCRSAGNVTSLMGALSRVGGVVGVMGENCVGTLTRCVSSGVLDPGSTQLAPGDLPMHSAVGGIIGYIGSFSFDPGYNALSAPSDEPGITLTECFSDAHLISHDDGVIYLVGGLVGSIEDRCGADFSECGYLDGCGAASAVGVYSLPLEMNEAAYAQAVTACDR